MTWKGILLPTLLVAAAGCASPGGGSSPGLRVAPVAEVPERCRVALGQDRPLVTEWSASDKAHLESLAAGQVVAVRYTGCEMQVIGACKVPGRYGYRRTTLATDTLEIQNAEDLFARLPIGAVGLEGELSRSGRLAVRTTVAGQYQLEEIPTQLPPGGACDEATHVITAISVGAFSLLTGGATSTGGSVGATSLGVGAKTRRAESTMRQAGDPKTCGDGNDKAPNPLCASPIQVFLRKLDREARDREVVVQARSAEETRARTEGALVEFPAPNDAREVWKIYNAAGQPVCQLPCSTWVPPRSGFYLERATASGINGLRLDFPHELPGKPGGRVQAGYSPGRGQPFWSLLTFIAIGAPSGVGAFIVGVLSLTEEDGRARDQGGTILMLTAFSAASTAWWMYSHDRYLKFRPQNSASALPSVQLSFTPFGLVGRF